ncbi:MAG: LysM peptidoglycan-binding domain-containing protein [Acidobacteria bacterium]|nr:LysM peptidoglycan-binding domain-containing protein [Acidobacteriota bacterium]
MKSMTFLISLLMAAILLFGSCTTDSKRMETVPPPADDKTAVEEKINAEQRAAAEGMEERTDDPETGEFIQETIEQESTKSVDDPAELLETAFNAYEDARAAWDKGDIETALKALDESYRLLLLVDVSDDSPLIQQKDELRLLIAQRIQEIYASRVSVGDVVNNRTIPLVENKHVLAEINRFQTVEKKYFLESYRRSGMYRDYICSVLREAGIPEELSWLPMIESWFKVNAYSRARALGLWQFISSTGLRFGLKRDRYIDERMDFIKAANAASKYLDELHTMFGDWTTALAAYNSGEYRVQRVIRAQRINYLDNFWDLYTMLPRETARFVPRFIATLLIIKDPQKYGMELPEPLPPLEFETVTIQKPAKLVSLAQTVGLSDDIFVTLNPELRHQSTPEGSYELRVPVGYVQKVQEALDSIVRYIPPEATYVIHYVRSGETVSGIAGRYRTSVSAIARLNNLGKRYLIRPGQSLKVPASGASSTRTSSPSDQVTREGSNLTYTVKQGDALYKIAGTFNTSVQNIKALNKLQGDRLAIGQILIIRTAGTDETRSYTVKQGDTPYEISKRFGMDLDMFLTINSLTRRSKIYPGQVLLIK